MSARRESPRLVAERDARLAELGPLPPWWRIVARRRWHRSRAAILAIDVSQMAEMLRSVYSSDRVAELANQPPPAFAALQMEPTPPARRPFVEPVDPRGIKRGGS